MTAKFMFTKVSERPRTRSTSRGRSVSAGRSPSRARSKSPARSKPVSEKRAETPANGTRGRKSIPKTPQISPARQSLRLAEKFLNVSLPEQNERKTWVSLIFTNQAFDLSVVCNLCERLFSGCKKF